MTGKATIAGASVGSQPALVADVGGTNARFGVVDLAMPRQLDHLRVYPTAGAGEFVDALAAYRAETSLAGVPTAVAIAGPVLDGRGALSNAAWQFDERELARAVGAPVRLQ